MPEPRAALWRDRRFPLLLVLGFAAGVPLPLVAGQVLRQWFAESDLSLSAIGLTALIGLAYANKFLWSPALDALPLSPFPSDLPMQSPRRVPGHNVYVSPLPAARAEALAASPQGGRSLFTFVHESSFAYQSPGRELQHINSRVSAAANGLGAGSGSAGSEQQLGVGEPLGPPPQRRRLNPPDAQ